MTDTAPEFKATNKPYKWLKREIESSDPYKDYVKIWRLSIEYTSGGDFVQNLLYAYTFANFVATEWVSDVMWRNGSGKVLTQATDRASETQYHFCTWWYYGPHHPETRKSIDTINKLHRSYAKSYPGHFSHTDDYIYLSGITEKQKIAAHLFWKEMSRLFLVEVPGQDWKPLSEFSGFPEDWDGMYSFCEDVEDHHMVVTDKGHMIAEALFDQFAFRYFPPLLRPLGRALPISLSLPQTLKAHRIKEVNPVLACMTLFVIGTFIWIMETFFPDPKISYQESLRMRSADQNRKVKEENTKVDEAFPAWFARQHQGRAASCPFTAPVKQGL
ncbi:hypothetical protein ABOM_000495 [Aspergillus bombycis]|uniref:ER-bound oxygenase mpaB/mpaB'/Rubber oxygenase catalytic domain-containing protein n=1 Tax=Aspergillus bombycis TaxID=109264 RepID=A0A1F8AGA5_9EURO|nr:hypothetical protein ABOM_000495 [Aspergillus bombycis]OGM50721.1 hypothetical protein ABOM_000495 [Aspergillus bombycis]